MKKISYIRWVILVAMTAGYAGVAMAEISVDKSQGQLRITSDIEGVVIAKVIGPDDVVMVDERYDGNSFNWSPSAGPDGAYRYDVRVISSTNEKEDANRNNYAGGSVEVINGEMPIVKGELK